MTMTTTAKGVKAREPRIGVALVLVFLLLAAGIVVAGVIYFRNYQRHYHAEVERQLSAVAELKAQELAQRRKERLADSAVFFKNPSFESLVRQFLENPADEDARRPLLDWLARYQSHDDFDDIRLLDAEGVARLSVPAGSTPASSDIARSASEALRSAQACFQDFYRNERDGRVYLAVLVPLFDEPGAGRPLGVVLMRIDPELYLYPFIQRWPTPSPTAETLLVRREGDEAVYLNEIRFRTKTALNLRFPLDRASLPAARAALRQEGITEGNDYRDVPVMAALRNVPDSPWSLVAKIDAAEVDAPMKERLWQVAAMVGMMVVVAGACAGLIWRRQRRLAEAALRRIEWLLTRTLPRGAREEQVYVPPYGDLLALNASRLILDSVGEKTLADIVGDYLDLLDTSAAVYERNGDYALGIFSSGWCRFMDAASRAVCDTADNREALACGRWHCHESCWTSASKAAMGSGESMDIECNGGIRLYAVPIKAGGEIIGSINFGYGDPPRDEKTLRALAAEYHVNVGELRALAAAYESRPPFIIELAKRRLHSSARLIGVMVERKQTEAKLREANLHLEQAIARAKESAAEAETANRAKSEFLAGMSHELRTPLNSVLILAQVLLENKTGNLTEEQLEFARVIRGSGRDLLSLINEILDLARIEARRMTLQLGAVRVGELAQGVRALFGRLAEEKGLRLQVTVRDDAPALVHSDRQRIEQIIRNLVSNAVKFTASGDVTVTFARPAPGSDFVTNSGLSPAECLAVEVKDTGIGIRREDQEIVFEAFRQVDTGTARKYGGTGLGLSISRELARLLGGDILLESELGQGSTFTLCLPAAGTSVPEGPPGETAAGSPVEDDRDRRKPDDGAAVLRDKKVLVVDDDARSVYAVSRFLSKHGMKTLTAENGAVALRTLDEQPDVDFVLMDIMMPEMDGYETMRRIREQERFRGLPILALTAKAMPDDAEKCLAAGASDYLAKPIDLRRLLTALAAWAMKRIGTHNR